MDFMNADWMDGHEMQELPFAADGTAAPAARQEGAISHRRGLGCQNVWYRWCGKRSSRPDPLRHGTRSADLFIHQGLNGR